MTQIRTVAPTMLPVTLDAAKLALRIDGDDLDSLVQMWMKGIVADLEQNIGQCIMEQTWEIRLPGFATTPIRLPHPAMEITSVTYLDEAGDEQLLDAGAYRLNQERYASNLTPARGATWPATAEDAAAVKIVLQCGYGDTPDATPEEVQLYILAKLVEQFDPATRLERDTVQSTFVAGLLDRCRSYG